LIDENFWRRYRKQAARENVVNPVDNQAINKSETHLEGTKSK
jgi:hypothetical protein